MSFLTESVVAPLAQSVSPVLIHSLWQGLLIAFLLKAALTVMGDHQSRWRYALTSSALASLVLLCLITGLSPAMENAVTTPISNPSEIVENTATTQPSGSVDHTRIRPVRQNDDKVFFPAPEQFDRWLIPFWLGGVLLLTVRHAVGYRRARSLLRNGTSPVPAVWKQRFERLCRDLKVSRPVRFLSSSIVKVPCVVGWLKPVVLFPVSSLAGLRVSDVEMILAHELAHVRRNDVLINIAQIVVETLLFFNPAVWWISRQMRIEREHCCDDLAIAVSGDRLDYARALVNLEETRRPAPEFAVGAAATGIVARVRRIVMNQAPRAQSANMGVIGMLLLAALLIVGVTALGGPASSDVAAATTFQASASFEPGRDDIKGNWEIETNGDWSQVSIRFKRDWQSGFSVKTSELLRDVDETTTSFRMQRDAGTFHFKGKFERDGEDLRGQGECYFSPNPEYVAKMGSLGYDLRSSEEVFELALHDVTLAYAQGLNDQGYDNLSVSKLVEAHIHDVTPEYIAALSALGYKNLGINKLIEMQIHDVDPDYIRGLADLGYTGLPPDRLVEMHIHDVDPDYIAALAKLGYSDLEPSRLVEMQIHDITPEYIEDLAQQGYKDLPPARLVEMQIHDVDADYIAALRKLGYTDLSPERLVEMRIHDIEPSYIEELAALGLKDISPADLVDMSIHDVTPGYIRELAKLGYENLTPALLVEMQIHDVTPSFVKRMQEKEGSDLTPRELIDFKIHGGK